MAKAKAAQAIHFALDEVLCRQEMYKNVEPHGNEDAGGWWVTFSNIMLSAEQFNDLMADPHADRAFFNQVKNVWEPMPWLKNVELKYLETFEEAVCTILYSKNEEEKTKCEVEFTKCPVKIISLEPLTTRVIAMSIKFKIKPKRRDLVLIHEHQHTQVRLSISNAKIAAGKKQSDMFDAKKDDQAEGTDETSDNKQEATGFNLARPVTTVASNPDSTPTSSDSSAADPAAVPPPAAEDDAKAFEDGAKKHVEAFTAKPGTVIDGRSERVKHRDRKQGAH